MSFPNPSIAAEAARKAIVGDSAPTHAERQALDDEELRELENATYAKVAPEAAAPPPLPIPAQTSIWRQFLDRLPRR